MTQANLSKSGEFLGQAQIALGSQQALHQTGGAAPEHGMALHHQFIANGSESVTFPNAWLARRR